MTRQQGLHTLRFAVVVGAGIGVALTLGQSLWFVLFPLIAALAALGLSPRAALAAGALAALAALSKTLMLAAALAPLSAMEYLRVALWMAGCGVLLAAIAALRPRSRLAVAALIVMAAPLFVAGTVPLARALDPMQLSSVYVPMRDGVRIALDVYLPRGAAEHALPAILEQTRYFRRTALKWPYSLLFASLRGDIRRFSAHGYAYLIADARGSGASFGSRQQEWSDDEIADGAQVVDWIVAQPWSSGKIGTTGVSYVGTAAEMLLANHHPAVKAAAPRFCLIDGYDDIAFPGGVHLSWFTENWGGYNDALDRNALTEKVQGFAKRTLKGVAPVDGAEELLAQAVADHKNNYDISGFAKGITYRDDASPSGLTLARMSPYAKSQIAAAGVPIYSYSGWYDGAYQRAAIERFLTYKIPGSRLIVGPWDHGARQNVSPHTPAGTPIFDQSAELMRFFDLYLKNQEDGQDHGFGAEKPVRYYTMGAETWHWADTWPPPAQMHTLHLAPERVLAEAAPATQAAPDQYLVDLTATTGTGTRWHSYFNTTGATIGYPERAQQDAKLLVYNSAPLSEDWEITGHPVIDLWIASSASDGQFFTYLEDVAPDGSVTYITEGELRGLHRKISDAPLAYWQAPPAHSFLRADGQPLTPGEPTEISFALLPTSYLVPKGHAIRVALAGADVDQFAPLPGAAPTWQVYHDTAHASRIVLPLVNVPVSAP